MASACILWRRGGRKPFVLFIHTRMGYNNSHRESALGAVWLGKVQMGMGSNFAHWYFF